MSDCHHDTVVLGHHDERLQQRLSSSESNAGMYVMLIKVMLKWILAQSELQYYTLFLWATFRLWTSCKKATRKSQLRVIW